MEVREVMVHIPEMGALKENGIDLLFI